VKGTSKPRENQLHGKGPNQAKERTRGRFSRGLSDLSSRWEEGVQERRDREKKDLTNFCCQIEFIKGKKEKNQGRRKKILSKRGGGGKPRIGSKDIVEESEKGDSSGDRKGKTSWATSAGKGGSGSSLRKSRCHGSGEGKERPERYLLETLFSRLGATTIMQVRICEGEGS